MTGVSQGLIDFANHLRVPASPGIEVIEMPRYRITLQPDYPVPGPNSVGWIRCTSDEAGEVIAEARAIVAPRHLPIMWTLDPETQPADFADHLAAHGVLPDAHGVESAVMVLPVDAQIDGRPVPGLVLHDALAAAEAFRAADAVNSEAFGAPPRDAASTERRRLNQLATPGRRVLLATVDGEPAGSAGFTALPPHGAMMNGGAVREKFRGLGVYRAMVAARVEMARNAGVGGLVVWGGDMSRPILEKLGFVKVGWRRFYVDTTTA